VSASRGAVRSDANQSQRQRKIRQVERQLANQASTSTIQTNSQTQRDIPLKMAGNKTMVAPGTRDAPKFSSKKPQELRRFVRLMEDLWKEAGIVDDEIKKASIGKYADQESEEEWTALDTYEAGHSWEDFKEELIENYPEAAAAERGTPARIKQLCMDTRDIKLGDLTALYAFRRAFMAEAKKLAKPPAAMSNRELVELFLGCLSESMASAILQFLGNTKDWSKSRTKAAVGEIELAASNTNSKASRRPEDRYDLDEVCKAAIQVSESSQGMFYLMNKSTYETTSTTGEREIMMLNQPVSETKAIVQKLEELEGAQALERDRLVNVNKNIDSKFNELEAMMKAILAQNQSQGRNSGRQDNMKPYDPNSGMILGQPGTVPKWPIKSMDNERCFYCGRMGHFQADCEEMKAQIKAGNLKLNPEGKLRLKDGSHIPGFPSGTCIKERVERHYARRPSQYYYGEYDDEESTSGPSGSRYTNQYVNIAEDADRRRTRLEYELDLKEKEEALELRKIRLEREEKRMEQGNKQTRAANVLDLLEQLTDEEISAIKAARSGFT
jgi:hypothetical protein